MNGRATIVGCMTAYGDDTSLLTLSLTALHDFAERVVVGVGRYRHHDPLPEDQVLQTVITARQTGAEVIVVDEWDEREARTRVADKAAESGDWCLWADADEEWAGDSSRLGQHLAIASASGMQCAFVQMSRPLCPDLFPVWVPKLYQYEDGQSFAHDYLVVDAQGYAVTHVMGEVPVRHRPFFELDPSIAKLLHYRDERDRSRTAMTGRYQERRRRHGYGD